MDSIISPPAALRLGLLTPKEAAKFSKLTYANYARNLTLLNDSWIAIGAWYCNAPVGLILGHVSRLEVPGRLLSVAVTPLMRRRTIGQQLLAELESTMRERGVKQIRTRHVAGMKGADAFAALLNRMGWPRGTISELSLTGEAGKMAAAGAEWRGVRVRLETPGPYTFPPWSELAEVDTQALARLQRQSAYHSGFDFGAYLNAIDPTCSLHIRRDGELIGWIAAVPFQGALVASYPERVCRRYVSAYVDESLWRSAIMLVGYYHSFSRQAAAYGENTIATYNSAIPGQMALTRRRFSPLALSMDEIIETSKAL